MAPETRTIQREAQEQSIKARQDELFEEGARNGEEGGGLRRPFRAYLHETPAAPLSLGVKASLWGAGAVVGLLFVAAIAGGHGTRAEVPTDLVIPASTPRPPVVALIPSPTATPAHGPTPTPRPDEGEEKKEKKKAPEPVTIVEANPNKPEPSILGGPKPETAVKAGMVKPENPTPAPAPAPAPTPMPDVAANDASTRSDNTRLGTAAPAEAPKIVRVSPQPAPGAAPTNTAPATPKEKPARKSSLFRKRPPYNPAYPKREPVKRNPMPNPSDSPTP